MGGKNISFEISSASHKGDTKHSGRHAFKDVRVLDFRDPESCGVPSDTHELLSCLPCTWTVTKGGSGS